MGNAGRNGDKYYNPRLLIRAIVQVTAAKLDERIYDGAVGSAGFLCEAFDYLRQQNPKRTTAQDRALTVTHRGKIWVETTLDKVSTNLDSKRVPITKNVRKNDEYPYYDEQATIVSSLEAQVINAISLDAAPFTDDMVHESARHALEQRRKYARWLDADDELVVANAMLIIIGRALNMLKSQIEAQGAAFEETGGFSERLTAKRIEAREKTREPSPECPQCNKPMCRRTSAKGEFWGCSGFPDCKGTRAI